jgi:hypothetical protein
MRARRKRSMVWLIAMAGAVGAAPPAARADDCAAVTAAAIARAQVPNAGTTTIAYPGQPAETRATIVTGGIAYLQVKGVWQSKPFALQAEIDRITRSGKEAKRNCSKVGAETVDGEPATIYAAHTENQDMADDTRLWVSDRSGLPLKSEIRFKDGATVLAAFRYDHIEAPVGVK